MALALKINWRGIRTEPLLGLAVGLDDLDDTSSERLNGWDVVGEDTHVTSAGSDVHLGDIGGLVEGLYRHIF